MTDTREEQIARAMPAIESLKNYQQQLDADGCMVGVSRQALDETLAFVATILSTEAAPSEPVARSFGLEILDDMEHDAKYQQPTVDPRRQQQMRIQALGAALSRRDWHATEIAYNAIRDAFDAHPPAQPDTTKSGSEG